MTFLKTSKSKIKRHMFAAQVACSFRLKYPKLLSDSMGTGKATRLSIYQKVTPTMLSGVKAPREEGRGGGGAEARRHGGQGICMSPRRAKAENDIWPAVPGRGLP